MYYIRLGSSFFEANCICKTNQYTRLLAKMAPTLRRHTRRSLDGWQTDLIIDFGTDDLPMEFKVVHNIMMKQELETAVLGEIVVHNEDGGRSENGWNATIGTHVFNAVYFCKICARITTIVNAANEGYVSARNDGYVNYANSSTIFFAKRHGPKHHLAINPGLEHHFDSYIQIIYENMVLQIVHGPAEATFAMDTPSPSTGGLSAINYTC